MSYFSASKSKAVTRYIRIKLGRLDGKITSIVCEVEARSTILIATRTSQKYRMDLHYEQIAQTLLKHSGCSHVDLFVIEDEIFEAAWVSGTLAGATACYDYIVYRTQPISVMSSAT